MIDKNGKKIVDKSETIDESFRIAEIRFILKGRQKNISDTEGIIFAQRIKDCIEKPSYKKNKDKIMDVLSMLEVHIDRAEIEDFFWELVYVRRKIAKKSYDCISKAEQYCTSASYFDKICLLYPTVHNQCCRVLEILSAVENYLEADNTESLEIAEKLLLKAEEYFSAISDNQTHLYSRTGKDLFIQKYVCDSRKNKPVFLLLQTLVSYAQESYFRGYEKDDLKYLVKVYRVFSKHKSFSLECERKNLENIVARIEDRCAEEKDALIFFKLFLNVGEIRKEENKY